MGWTVGLKPDYSNWKDVSAQLSRKSFLRGASSGIDKLDQAIAAYGANKTYATRLELARVIYRWYNSSTCDKSLLAALLSRLSLDVGGKQVKEASLNQPPQIIIPLDEFRDRAVVVEVANASDCDSFVPQVKDALRQINAGVQGFGAALLNGLRENMKPCWPYAVKIFHGNGNTTYEEPSGATQPCHSRVRWDPMKLTVGDGTGQRPTYVALAHEMIHAYHFAAGVNRKGTPEEAATVGLEQWWTDPEKMDLLAVDYRELRYFGQDTTKNSSGNMPYLKPYRHLTENLIRHEHGVPLRVAYKGQIGMKHTPGALAYAQNHAGYDVELGWYASNII